MLHGYLDYLLDSPVKARVSGTAVKIRNCCDKTLCNLLSGYQGMLLLFVDDEVLLCSRLLTE